jgi:hypothetical protein
MSDFTLLSSGHALQYTEYKNLGFKKMCVAKILTAMPQPVKMHLNTLALQFLCGMASQLISNPESI